MWLMRWSRPIAATIARTPVPGGLFPRPSLTHISRSGQSQHHEHLRLHSSLETLSKLNTEIAEPTIYALSTAAGKAAIAIIRISGIACIDIYRALCPDRELPKPRYASLRTIFEPTTPSQREVRKALDAEALVIYFPAPTTVTGEDVLELHVHGGPAVVKAILTALGRCDSAPRPVRYAEPGEFTRRAFFNNRIDLTQVEALGETLSAVTEEQRRISIRGANGGLAARYESWRNELLQARGELEALIDFSEDQHFDESPASLVESVASQVRSLQYHIGYHSQNAMRGELLRNGIAISLIGAPNVGKSSLLNLIVGRNAAIVSEEAGTTRDVVEVGVDLGGFFCRFGDTAGLRQSLSPQKGNSSSSGAVMVGNIELEGIRRAKEKAMGSDLVIVMLPVEPSIEGQGAQLSLDPEVISTAKQLLERDIPVVIVINKIDNYDRYTDAAKTHCGLTRSIQNVLPGFEASRIVSISCREAEDAQKPNHRDAPRGNSVQDPGDLQAFLDALIAAFKSLTSPLIPESGLGSVRDSTAETDSSIWHESLGATERQRALLEQCSVHLREFLAQTGNAIDIVMAAESLRAAAGCLSKITGKGEAGDVEEVLGVVFEKFCVGK